MSKEMDFSKVINDAILDPQVELKELVELLKVLCGKKKQNYTTGPVIKPVQFNDNSQEKQTTSSFLIVKALNNTNSSRTATVQIYNLGSILDTKTKDNCIEVNKELFFTQTIEVQPQSTMFLPVGITELTEYEVQVLDATEGMYFSTEFIPTTPIPTTPIPTAQGGIISNDEDVAGAVIDSHIVNYSHQFVLLDAEF